MAAAKGNTYAKDSGVRLGRHRLFKRIESGDVVFKDGKEVIELAEEYINWCANNPKIQKDFIRSGQEAGKIINIEKERTPTIKGFCAYIGIDTTTFENYCKEDYNKDNFRSFIHVRDIFESELQDSALSGNANATFAAMILGLRQRTDMTSNGETVVSSVSFVFGVQSEGNKAIGESTQHKLDKE